MLQALKDTLPADSGETARDVAVRIVDARYSYTAEYAPDPDAHRAEYDLEEERLAFSSADRDVLHELRVALDDALAGGRPGVEPIAVVGMAAITILYRYGNERMGAMPAQVAGTCLATLGDLVSDSRDEYGQAAALAFSLAGDHDAAQWARERFGVDVSELEPLLQAAFAIADPSLTADVLSRIEPGALRTLVETVSVRRQHGADAGEDFWELVRAAYMEDQARGARRASDWATNLFISSTAAIPGGGAIRDNHLDR